MPLGYKHTIESKEKMRLAKLGKPSGMLGKHCSAEKKEKLRIANTTPKNLFIQRNKIISNEARVKISKANKGKKLTEIQCRNIGILSSERWKDAKYRDSMTGTNHPNWRGDEVGYSGTHLWVKKIFGSPKICEFCGSQDDRPYHWAAKNHSIGGRNRKDWYRLCVPCHKIYDNLFNLFVRYYILSH